MITKKEADWAIKELERTKADLSEITKQLVKAEWGCAGRGCSNLKLRMDTNYCEECWNKPDPKPKA